MAQSRSLEDTSGLLSWASIDGDRPFPDSAGKDCEPSHSTFGSLAEKWLLPWESHGRQTLFAAAAAAWIRLLSLCGMTFPQRVPLLLYRLWGRMDSSHASPNHTASDYCVPVPSHWRGASE